MKLSLFLSHPPVLFLPFPPASWVRIIFSPRFFFSSFFSYAQGTQNTAVDRFSSSAASPFPASWRCQPIGFVDVFLLFFIFSTLTSSNWCPYSFDHGVRDTSGRLAFSFSSLTMISIPFLTAFPGENRSHPHLAFSSSGSPITVQLFSPVFSFSRPTCCAFIPTSC